MTTDSDRAITAERAVIGALLNEASIYDEVAPLLSPSDFTGINAHWFGAICAQAEAGKAFDPIGLSDVLGPQSLPDLIDLANSTASAVNAVHYAHIIRAKSKKRKLNVACEDARNNPDLEQAQEGLHKTLDEINDEISTGPKLLSAFESEYLHQQSVGRMATGLLDLDEFGGVGDGEVCVIGARPNIGKSTLLHQVAQRQARADIPVLCFDIEDPGIEVYSRGLKANWPKDLPMWIDESSPINIRQLCATARTMRRKHGIRAVFVDYLQLVLAEGINKNERIETVSAGLKSLAKQLKVPVYAAAQLNRGSAQGAPKIEDLRDSGAIEQDANQVWLLHVDDRYPAVMEIHVAKNKSGPKGVALVRHIPDQFRVVSTDVATQIAHREATRKGAGNVAQLEKRQAI